MKTPYQGWLQEREDLRTEGNALLEAEERTEEQQARIDEIAGRLGQLNEMIAKEDRVREVLRAAPPVQGSGRGSREMNDLIRQAAGRG